jgi:putative regulatory protein
VALFYIAALFFCTSTNKIKLKEYIMKKWLLAVLPATALAAPPQGFYQNY